MGVKLQESREIVEILRYSGIVYIASRSLNARHLRSEIRPEIECTPHLSTHVTQWRPRCAHWPSSPVSFHTLMEDPPTIVKGKSEPSSAVNPEVSSAATLTFAQALQTIDQPDVRKTLAMIQQPRSTDSAELGQYIRSCSAWRCTDYTYAHRVGEGSCYRP